MLCKLCKKDISHYLRTSHLRTRHKIKIKSGIETERAFTKYFK